MKKGKKSRLGMIVALVGMVLAIPLPVALGIKIVMDIIAIIGHHGNLHFGYIIGMVISFFVGSIFIGIGAGMKDATK